MDKQHRNLSYKYVWNRTQLQEIDHRNTEYIMGKQLKVIFNDAKRVLIPAYERKHNDQQKRDKQRSKKRYTKNKRSSNMNSVT